ncbi:MAG: alpha/beta hydrolase [Deltaproteobacteria bacterium]|nr:alpha/beta hydrolase [Deltaproteobacteria bacterium]MBT6431598.1 alpha/beta hydrolase [Deltaproteobacteria bacterium]
MENSIESIELSVLGQTIRGWTSGPEDGVPVLALHGWLDNANSFAPLAQILGAGYRLVAVDLPGHGLSDHRRAGASYAFADWVAPVTGLVDALGWEKFVLMGHSMGAGIATLVAGTFPERIRSLILLEGLGPLTTTPEKSPAQLARHVRNRLEQEVVRNARTFKDREEAAQRLSEAVQGLPLEAARLLVERGTKQVAGGYTWSTDGRLKTPSSLRLSEEHVLAFLQAIAAPSLLILGESGMRFPESTYSRRRGSLDGLKVEKIPGGHHVHMESHVAVATSIAEFLNPLLDHS